VLNDPTMNKLHELRLSAMAEAWTAQQKDPTIGSLSFDERLALLIDIEHMARLNRKLARLLKDAELRIANAVVEDVETSPQRGLDRAMLKQLGTCTWISEHQNVLITGATGVGKSYLACALAQAACRQGKRVLYRRAPRLIDELALAKTAGQGAKLLSRFAKLDLLVIDDLGIGTLKDAQRQDLLEVIDDRYGRSATIITSQLPLGKWHEWVADPTLADAILDRIVHNAYKLDLKGPSRRKEKPNQT
jgi:DNA replication protein DnaC